MRTQWQPSQPVSAKEPDSRLNTLPTAASPARLPLSPPNDPLLRRRYQELTRKNLNGLMHKLFAEFTGLHFRIAWPRGHPTTGPP